MPAEARRLHAKVFGHVQGVNFRYYTRLTASQIGVTGWVRNRSDGSVEVVAEGTALQIERLVQFLNVGPQAAAVTRVETDWLTATGEFADFQIN
ncbi:MAG: acylphosphatase [Anaerolineaceae bacterium]|nr:acylphosphatase [Anaerolineaceae bacterium]